MMLSQNRQQKLLSTALVCLLLSACQGIPQKHEQATPSVALGSYPATGNTVLSDGSTATLAQTRWQDFYADKNLKQLIELGLANNRDLKTAILNIEKARAQYQISDVQNAPTISANAGYTRSGNFDGISNDNYNVGLGMSAYEFDFWGRIKNLKAQALESFIASQYAADSAQISLISNIAQSYVSLSFAHAQLQLAQQTLENQQHALELNQQRFKAGIDSKLTVVQAQTAVAAAQSAIANAKTNIAQNNNALRILIGQDIPKNLLPTHKINQLTSSKLFNAGLPSQLLQFRPDILASEANLRAAGANIEVARAAYFPTISLSGNLGTASNDLTNLFKSGSFSWSIGPTISLPLFDAGKRDAQLQMAQIDQQQAVINYEKSIEQAFKEVADVFANRATLADKLAAENVALNASKTSLQISQARFKAGLDNYLSVLDAQRGVFNSQQSILNLEQTNLISQIQLYQVLGGGVKIPKHFK